MNIPCVIQMKPLLLIIIIIIISSSSSSSSILLLVCIDLCYIFWCV